MPPRSSCVALPSSAARPFRRSMRAARTAARASASSAAVGSVARGAWKPHARISGSTAASKAPPVACSKRSAAPSTAIRSGATASAPRPARRLSSERSLVSSNRESTRSTRRSSASTACAVSYPAASETAKSCRWTVCPMAHDQRSTNTSPPAGALAASQRGAAAPASPAPSAPRKSRRLTRAPGGRPARAARRTTGRRR